MLFGPPRHFVAAQQLGSLTREPSGRRASQIGDDFGDEADINWGRFAEPHALDRACALNKSHDYGNETLPPFWKGFGCAEITRKMVEEFAE